MTRMRSGTNQFASEERMELLTTAQDLSSYSLHMSAALFDSFSHVIGARESKAKRAVIHELMRLFDHVARARFYADLLLDILSDVTDMAACVRARLLHVCRGLNAQCVEELGIVDEGFARIYRNLNRIRTHPAVLAQDWTWPEGDVLMERFGAFMGNFIASMDESLVVMDSIRSSATDLEEFTRPDEEILTASISESLLLIAVGVARYAGAELAATTLVSMEEHTAERDKKKQSVRRAYERLFGDVRSILYKAMRHGTLLRREAQRAFQPALRIAERYGYLLTPYDPETGEPLHSEEVSQLLSDMEEVARDTQDHDLMQEIDASIAAQARALSTASSEARVRQIVQLGGEASIEFSRCASYASVIYLCLPETGLPDVYPAMRRQLRWIIDANKKRKEHLEKARELVREMEKGTPDLPVLHQPSTDTKPPNALAFESERTDEEVAEAQAGLLDAAELVLCASEIVLTNEFDANTQAIEEFDALLTETFRRIESILCDYSAAQSFLQETCILTIQLQTNRRVQPRLVRDVSQQAVERSQALLERAKDGMEALEPLLEEIRRIAAVHGHTAEDLEEYMSRMRGEIE